MQADSRTIHALGGYALTAITAVTAQNTRGIFAWKAVPPALIAAQISAVMNDFPVAALKTGLLPGVPAARAVARALAGGRKLPLVIDPVIASSSGTRFLSTAGVRELKSGLFPWAALVTPNWPEAEALTGRRVRSREEVEAAADHLLQTGCRAVLIKGGHAPGRICPDYLAMANGGRRWYEDPRVATRNKHGTGCVLSAAIAIGLARGEIIEAAVAAARQFLRQSLLAGKAVRWGKGSGPAFPG